MKCSICNKDIEEWLESDDGSIYCSEICFEKTLPKCKVCQRLMDSWIELENGEKFCSDDCLKINLPKCSICGNVMEKWIENSKGEKYCSSECQESILPVCSICNKKVKEWIELDSGEKFCSELCYDSILPCCATCGEKMESWRENGKGEKYCSEKCEQSSWPICEVCNKVMDHWIEAADNKKYCSENCFYETLPKCDQCGKAVLEGFVSEEKYYCSDECFKTNLPHCSYCGKAMKNWVETTDGKKYCSDECLEIILPKCSSCEKTMDTWIEDQEGRKFCSIYCINRNDGILSLEEMSFLTGLTQDECRYFAEKNNLTIDEAYSLLELYMESLNGEIELGASTILSIKNAGIANKLAQNLSSYNTMRGGTNGFKGFVFEEMHCSKMITKGENIQVVGNNGIADFMVVNKDGSVSYLQAKAGYGGQKIDWSRYNGQKIVVDKGNTSLLNQARNAGLEVIESDVAIEQAEKLSKAMQFESRITGKTNAPIVSNVYSWNQAGLQSAKFIAKAGLGLNIGSNLYDVINGNKEVSDAIVDTIFETAKASATAYIGGVVFSAGATASSMLASTAIGATVTAASTAIASTALGTTTMATIGTAIASVGGVTAAVASAPAVAVVGAAVVVGFIGKAFKSLFS